jgi:hypothetical protein
VVVTITRQTEREREGRRVREEREVGADSLAEEFCARA